MAPYNKVSIFENQSCMVLLELHEFWCSFTKETKPLNKRGVGQVKMVGFLNLAQLACFGQLALGGDSWGNYSVRDDSPPKLYTLTCRSLPSCTNHILHNFQMKSRTQETKSSRSNKYTFTLCIYLYHIWLCHHVLAKLWHLAGCNKRAKLINFLIQLFSDTKIESKHRSPFYPL